MLHFVHPLVVIVILFISVGGAAAERLISESQAVRIALEGNPTLTLVRLDRRGDSLSLEQVEAQWLPTADLEAGVSLAPRGDGGSPTSANAEVSLSARQAVPGGGRLTASTTGEGTWFAESDSAEYPRSFSVGFHQPLLRDSWGRDPIGYRVRVQQLDSRKFDISQIGQVAGVLSEVRRRYWDGYEKMALYGIQESRVAYARSRLESARARLARGTASLLDTLAAHYEYLQATQARLRAQVQDSLALRALARELSVAPEELGLDTGDGPALAEVPDAESFLRDAEGFDPQLRIFEVLREKLDLQIRNDRNGLLPDLTAGVDYRRDTRGDSPWAEERVVSGNTVFSLILKYSWPTRERRIALAKSAVAVERNAVEAEDRRAEVSDRVKEMMFSWRQELRALEVAEASHEVALKKVEASRVGYELGTVDRVTLLKDESDYMDAATGLLSRKVELKRLEIACDELTGAVLERFGLEVQ